MVAYSKVEAKFLSPVGKEILLRSVVQAIPFYTMSVFLLPLDLCAELECMMNSFWWGSGGRGQGEIRWKRWELLCRLKVVGGLSFHRVYEFNLALLGKQVWGLLSNPNSFVTRVYGAHYFPRSDILQAEFGYNPSYVWCSVWAAIPILRFGLRWNVGSGASISIWQDPWLPSGMNPYVSSVASVISHYQLVC
ncbi:hypothetical protein P3X46_003649 [Hevea brasiliensis]|uniref:Reverse transcriptase zinc-binding domain-containing protein n=1 Tax=Hevea brasiliensis TaxID=3981 RepID=A0ABQ9N949_HEVBR|nr:uncharacterized mitochondrial protein AtMg00310 [Hevea brasiliensis]KAJ9188278.1 hypothetical protein P3X46_003649 [Hevea brasiliensis]